MSVRCGACVFVGPLNHSKNAVRGKRFRGAFETLGGRARNIFSGKRSGMFCSEETFGPMPRAYLIGTGTRTNIEPKGGPEASQGLGALSVRSGAREILPTLELPLGATLHRSGLVT